MLKPAEKARYADTALKKKLLTNPATHPLRKNPRVWSEGGGAETKTIFSLVKASRRSDRERRKGYPFLAVLRHTCPWLLK